MRVDKLLAPLLLFFVLLATSAQALHPEAQLVIRWKAEPVPFVESLYNGVFMRPAESPAIVQEWAAKIDGTPKSKLDVFWAFVNSDEHKKAFPQHMKGNWSVYWAGAAGSRSYQVSKSLPKGFNGHSAGPYSLPVARAIWRFHKELQR